MRLPEFVGATRTTISSVKPIQRLRWLASIRPADLSDATIVQPICWAVSSARTNAASDRSRQDVRIRSPLLVGKLGALIGDRIDAFTLPQRHDRHKDGRIVRVGRDVVDW